MNKTNLVFDAIFHAYKFNSKVEECLSSLMAHHPHTNVYVCVDGGGDPQGFIENSEKYNIKQVISYDENILPKARFKDRFGPKKYVERIINLLSFCNREWCLLLEDDVRILKPISSFPLVADAAGPSGYPLSPNLVFNIEKVIKTSLKNINYGFCGGTMFRTNLYDGLAWRKLNFDKLIELDWRCGTATDICLTVLCYLNNKLYSKWIEFGEINNPSENNPDCSVLHNVK